MLAVKGNQANLNENIRLYFNDPDFLNKVKAEGGYIRTMEKAHGHIETREYYQTEDIGWIPEKERWAGIKSIGVVKTTVLSGQDSIVDFRYYISSLKVNPTLFSLAARGYWSVESMHWHLDVTFREDHNQTLNKNAAENLNILRKLALSILKLLDLGKKYSLKKKRFAISCGFERYLNNLMSL